MITDAIRDYAIEENKAITMKRAEKRADEIEKELAEYDRAIVDKFIIESFPHRGPVLKSWQGKAVARWINNRLYSYRIDINAGAGSI